MKPQSVELIKEAISNVLYGGSSDPLDENLEAAAQMVEVLILEGHKDQINQDWMDALRGDNLYKQNFLEHLGYSKILETY